MIPPTSWRPDRGSGVLILGPATCQGCGAPVWYGRAKTRVEGVAVMGEARIWRDWGRYVSHRCVPKAKRTSTERARDRYHRLHPNARYYSRRAA